MEALGNTLKGTPALQKRKLLKRSERHPDGKFQGLGLHLQGFGLRGLGLGLRGLGFAVEGSGLGV